VEGAFVRWQGGKPSPRKEREGQIYMHAYTRTPSKGVKFQPPGLLLVVKGFKNQTLGGFR